MLTTKQREHGSMFSQMIPVSASAVSAKLVFSAFSQRQQSWARLFYLKNQLGKLMMIG
jgi:hypothetical protein